MMDTKVFFERGDEFKDNPLHFAVHRISNLGTWTKVVNAKTRLEKGDIDGCKEALDNVDAELVGMIEFLRQFAKEYDEFKEAGNVIIPKRTKYTIAIKQEPVERDALCYNSKDERFFIFPAEGGLYSEVETIGAQVLIVSDEKIEDTDKYFSTPDRKVFDSVDRPIILESTIIAWGLKKVIGKAPQFIIDGLISGKYFEGDKVKVKMKIKEEQVRYTNGEYAREYQEVEVPEVIDGIVTCEK